MTEYVLMTPDELVQNGLIFGYRSADNEIYMGIYPVIYGYRVNAGYTGDIVYQFSICAGNDQKAAEEIFSIVLDLFRNRHTKNPFRGIPHYQERRPYYYDENFVADLRREVDFENIEKVRLLPLALLRAMMLPLITEYARRA